MYHIYPRTIKKSLKDHVTLPPFDALSRNWKEEILTEIKYIWRDGELCGVAMDPCQFIKNYLRRFLLRRRLEGEGPVPGNYKVKFKVGSDGGRHGWFKWASGPAPSGSSMTHSISIYDCTLLSMESMVGTPMFTWLEPKPCSDKVTRGLALIMAEEGEDILGKAIIWLQKQQEKLRNGFSIVIQVGAPM